jgi:hypothetical protein
VEVFRALRYTGAVKALRAVGQTFAVLAGIWLVFAMIAIVAGILPVPGFAGRNVVVEAAPTSDEEAADAGVAEAEGEDAGVAAAPDAGPPDAGSSRSARARDRFAVCPEPAMQPSLSAIDVFGDARSELVVGCGDHWDVIGVENGTPQRVARIDAPTVEADSSPGTGPVVAVDVDGEGTRDLVLPFARWGAGGATRGGALYVAPRDRFGGFQAPRSLAPIAAVYASSGPIDGDAVNDLAVVNLSNPFARLPSEVWVFSGGPTPRRRAVLRTGTGGQALGLADLDRDRQLDVVVVATDDSRVDVFFGDGTGVFPRHGTLAVPNPVGIAVGDVDGDGRMEAIVEAGGVTLVRVRSGDAVEAVRIEGVPTEIRGIEAVDLDDDRASEIVGWDHPRLVVLDDPGGEDAEVRTLIEIEAASFAPRRQRFADVDGDGAAELVLLGVTATETTRSLELVIVPGGERGTVAIGERREVADAPLVLRVPLPDAQ